MRVAVVVIAMLLVAAAVAPAAGPPAATTGAAKDLGQTTATVTGTVDPQGMATTYHFEYGTSSSYGLQSTEQDAGSGTGAADVQAALTGLTGDTTYHYRVVATNAAAWRGATTAKGRVGRGRPRTVGRIQRQTLAQLHRHGVKTASQLDKLRRFQRLEYGAVHSGQVKLVFGFHVPSESQTLSLGKPPRHANPVKIIGESIGCILPGGT